MRNPEAMLRDIEAETHFCQAWIGKTRLDSRVMQAMAKVPRALFLPEDSRDLAFRNGPVPIGHGQTISQPFIVALMTDLLALPAESRVLEIGTGSGYQAAVLAELAREVYSVEVIAPLARQAEERLRDQGYCNVHVLQGDGYAGWPEHAPYDGIIVTAAAPHVPPALLEQLKPGARLVIPVGPAGGPQQLNVLMTGGVPVRDGLPVAFVPLTGSLVEARPAAGDLPF